MRSGFWTREDARKPRKRAKREVDQSVFERMGVAGVRTMNPAAKHPAMAPEVPKKTLMYVLGGFPSEGADQRGVPFKGGKPEALLRGAIPSWARKQVAYDYCVRTRPPKDRNPLPSEISCFRKVVEESIANAKPRVVLVVGMLPLQWTVGLSHIKTSRGKRYPASIGGHECWVCPVTDPGFLLDYEGQRVDKVPVSEWRDFWQADIEAAADLAAEGPVSSCVGQDEARVPVAQCLDLDAVEAALDRLSRAGAVGWDWETHRLRPYYRDARLLSVAFSDGKRAYAIPVDHDEAPWTGADRKILQRLLEDFLARRKPHKIAHNLPFEMEWALHQFDRDKVLSGSYGCSMQAAFVLDPGPPGEKSSTGLALNDLCLERYGLNLKKMTRAGSMRGQLRDVRLNELLEYNGLDAVWCVRLWRDLMKEIQEDARLEESYRRQMDRITPIVLTQMQGVPVDQSITHKFSKQFDREARKLNRRIMESPAVKQYEALHGTFNPESPKQVGVLLGDVLALKGVRTESGSYKTGADILSKLKDPSGIVAALLEKRGISKLRGTYVDRFMPDHAESYVYPDGKIHCTFSITGTRTGRLSSQDPNQQNWPKRKHKEIRSQMAAPPGHVFLAVDQGQIEARVIAMDSRDERWVGMLFEDYDIHMEYAEKLVKIEPRLLKDFGDMKGVRAHVKNQWVFPAFYGSAPKSIIGKMRLPPGEAEDLFQEFWDTFAGVKRWQYQKWDEYKEHGCVWSLTGRRRWGPMSRNMVVNTPIQCTASDISEDANDRLSKQARDEDKPWLQSVLAIHDDLTFIVPESKLEEAIEDVVVAELSFDAEWVNVPLLVEAEVGPNLAEMEAIGSWRSDEI